MGDRTGQTVQLGDPNSGHNVVLTADYDYNGNRTKLSANVGGTLNSNGTVSNGTPDFTNGYSFDNLGNMTAIAQTAQTGYNHNGVATKYVALGYDADSRLTGVSYSVPVAGVTTVVAGSTYGYDHASRLTDLSYVDGANNPNTLASYHWSYDTDSRVTDFYSRSDTNTTQSTPTSSYTTWAHTQYTYDHDSQLTSTTYSTFANAPTADTNSSPSYDANGNRTNNGAAGTGNRLLSDGTYDYTYDPDGNRIAQTTTSGTIYVYGAFQYNNDNQLTQVGSSLAQGCINYAYDPFGRMVSRHNVSGGGTQNYIYDGQNIVLVLNASGQVIQRNLYGPAVDQVLATETVTAGNSPQAAGPVNWYLTDNQGTVRDVVQFNGTATIEKDHLVYDSFGQITSQSSATDQPTFTSYGLWQDPTTAIDYAEARWYTAVDGVFLSQDPISFLSGQTNLSEYCGNSPTNYTDPSGLQPPPPPHDPRYSWPPPGSYYSGGVLVIPSIWDNNGTPAFPPPPQNSDDQTYWVGNGPLSAEAKAEILAGQEAGAARTEAQGIMYGGVDPQSFNAAQALLDQKRMAGMNLFERLAYSTFRPGQWSPILGGSCPLTDASMIAAPAAATAAKQGQKTVDPKRPVTVPVGKATASGASGGVPTRAPGKRPTPSRPRPPVQNPGKYSGNSGKYQKVPTGTPRNDGWWVERYYRMTPEEAQAYRDACGDRISELHGEQGWTDEAARQQHNMQEMSKFRTEWLNNFVKNRK